MFFCAENRILILLRAGKFHDITKSVKLFNDKNINCKVKNIYKYLRSTYNILMISNQASQIKFMKSSFFFYLKLKNNCILYLNIYSYRAMRY